jgi:hypothetical protein
MSVLEKDGTFFDKLGFPLGLATSYVQQPSFME